MIQKYIISSLFTWSVSFFIYKNLTSNHRPPPPEALWTPYWIAGKLSSGSESTTSFPSSGASILQRRRWKPPPTLTSSSSRLFYLHSRPRLPPTPPPDPALAIRRNCSSVAWTSTKTTWSTYFWPDRQNPSLPCRHDPIPCRQRGTSTSTGETERRLTSSASIRRSRRRCLDYEREKVGRRRRRRNERRKTKKKRKGKRMGRRSRNRGGRWRSQGRE